MFRCKSVTEQQTARFSAQIIRVLDEMMDPEAGIKEDEELFSETNLLVLLRRLEART